MTLDVVVQGPPTAPTAPGTAYPIAPVSVALQAGILIGEITDMRVLARVEPRLTGTLRLRNTSETHSVRLVAAKIEYLDDRWQPIRFEGSRTAATFKFTAYGADRLDPGQEARQAVDVPCPSAALTPGTLKGLRLELAQVTSPYREEVVSFAVAIESRPADR